MVLWQDAEVEGFTFGAQPLPYCQVRMELTAGGRRRRELQRLFSSFPGGWPGVGLLLLRGAAGVTAGIQGAVYLSGREDPTFWIAAAGLAGLLAGLTLSIGLLTPVAGVMVAMEALSVALSWLPAPAPNLFDAPLPTALVVIVAVAVVFLGPGAFSLDARLFGRREIIIPPMARTPKA